MTVKHRQPAGLGGGGGLRVVAAATVMKSMGLAGEGIREVLSTITNWLEEATITPTRPARSLMEWGYMWPPPVTVSIISVNRHLHMRSQATGLRDTYVSIRSVLVSVCSPSVRVVLTDNV